MLDHDSMTPTGAPFCYAPVGEFDFYFGPETSVFSSDARRFSTDARNSSGVAGRPWTP